MLTSRYALCAIRIIRDATENRMSAVDIVEEIGSQSYPILLPRISFIWVLAREREDRPQHRGEVIVRQGEAEISRFPLSIDFQESLISRAILVVGGLVIPQPGIVSVVFEMNELPDLRTEYIFSATAAPPVVNQPGGPAAPQGGLAMTL